MAKKPTKKPKTLPALATRAGDPISSDKLRRAMKRVGKKGPKKKQDPKFRGVTQS